MTPIDSTALRLVELASIIRVEYLRGAGTEQDPARNVTAYYSQDGKFLAEHDPSDRRGRLISCLIKERDKLAADMAREVDARTRRAVFLTKTKLVAQQENEILRFLVDPARFIAETKGNNRQSRSIIARVKKTLRAWDNYRAATKAENPSCSLLADAILKDVLAHARRGVRRARK